MARYAGQTDSNRHFCLTGALAGIRNRLLGIQSRCITTMLPGQTGAGTRNRTPILTLRRVYSTVELCQRVGIVSLRLRSAEPSDGLTPVFQPDREIVRRLSAVSPHFSSGSLSPSQLETGHGDHQSGGRHIHVVCQQRWQRIGSALYFLTRHPSGAHDRNQLLRAGCDRMVGCRCLVMAVT
jgi:hypothetical protein